MATIKELHGAYPDVPLEVLRAPRRNKQAGMQATIDALVAALEAAQKTNSAILTEGGLKIDKWWDGLVAAQQGIAAALALARGGPK